jgi:hypothetical protein
VKMMRVSIIEQWDGVIRTSNPLRAGEPGILFAAESNVWGKEDNHQKVWQHLAMSIDRCQVLNDLLSRMNAANDFAKRTMASYLVLELHAIFTMMRRKRFKKLESAEPRSSALIACESEIDNLLSKNAEFAKIRDKIIAHLDGNLGLIETRNLWIYLTKNRIDSWLTILYLYITELGLYFPYEHTMHIKMRNIPLNMTRPMSSDSENGYIPFE